MVDVLPEQIGRYRILGELGRGAMGTVYRGRDAGLEREVAVKVVSVGDADEEALARFRREARAAGRLQHPNIVTVYEFGEYEGRPFMALELLEGLDLQHAIVSGLKPDPRATLPIVLQVLAGLGHAHDHGVVHRDVKPSNIFLPRGRPAKLMDFGIARLGGSTNVGFTTAGMVVGTPNYMSPEQAMGAGLDGRSDLFSAGLIIYELVTGERAYAGDSVVSVLYKIVHESPDLSVIPPEAQWDPLRRVVARSLAKRPDDRYPDARTMAEELLGAASSLGGQVDSAAASDLALMPRPATRTAVIREAPTRHESSLPPTREHQSVTPHEEARVPRAVLWIAAATLALALGVGGIAYLRFARPAPARGPSSSEAPEAPRATPTGAAPVVLSSAPSTPRSQASPSPALSVATQVTPPPLVRGDLQPESTLEKTPPPLDSSPVEERLARARASMERGLHAQALEEARSVLRTNPLSNEAKDIATRAEATVLIEESVKLARVALDEGRKDDALSHLRRGLTANPSEPRLLALFREAIQ